MPRWQRALAVFQMVGGIACIAGAFHHFSADSEGVALRVFVIPVFAGALAAIAGFLVAVRDTFGIWLSFLIQAAQVLSYNIGWNYLYVTGPKVVWVLNSLGTGLLLGAGGMAGLGSAPSDGIFHAAGVEGQVFYLWSMDPGATATWVIGINFVSIYFVRRLWQELERRAAEPAAGPAA